MTTNPNIDALIDFLTRQMDGDQPPPTGSAEEREIAAAIEAIHKNASDQILGQLALRTVGLVIDRMRSGIASEIALRNFIQPGGRA
ncbi:hypothetical protein FFI97_006010 [Variovorax sp. KBS0712]|uniref:hypothetical protein n=1 Tax=Variovorax sp. KBS0712 TaxID=2578111 RepID=UPI00111AFE9E|nr:hypothetical protein [Variovorax sp. KBS0712]TSD59863.1 hypothetical protein FFI97_006010 [Variovorax sp. KBS0712]